MLGRPGSGPAATAPTAIVATIGHTLNAPAAINICASLSGAAIVIGAATITRRP